MTTYSFLSGLYFLLRNLIVGYNYPLEDFNIFSAVYEPLQLIQRGRLAKYANGFRSGRNGVES